MHLTKAENMLFALLRYSLNAVPFDEKLFKNASDSEWNECYAVAQKQGVMALAWDAVLALPAEFQVYKALKIKWAMAVENYSKRYGRYCETVSALSAFYASHGIATVQMKGVGLSSYYPIPQRREGGDIDIYTYSADASVMSDKEANDLADKLMETRGAEVEYEYYKHSNFHYKGIPVENHKYFLNVKGYKTGEEAEKLLKANFNPETVLLDGKYEVSIPSLEFNSLFVICHAIQHYCAGLSLHQLCDWACILKKSDLALVRSVKDEKFRRTVDAFNYIVKEYLGQAHDADGIRNDEEIVAMGDRILSEVLHPKFDRKTAPTGKIAILCFKTRRFAYMQKRRKEVLEYSVSKAVLDSIISHLKNPKTIFSRA